MATKKQQCKKCRRIIKNCRCESDWKMDPKNKRTPKLRATIISMTQRNFSKEKACRYAGISTVTLNEWLKKDEQLLEDFTTSKGYIDVVAENHLLSSVAKGNINDVKWYLERTNKKYKKQSKEDDTKNTEKRRVPKITVVRNKKDIWKLKK